MPNTGTSQLTLTLDDPETIELLLGYQAFIADVDGIADCSLEEAATGLIAGCLDGHRRFTNWRKENPESPKAITNLVTLSEVRDAARTRSSTATAASSSTPEVRSATSRTRAVG